MRMPRRSANCRSDWPDATVTQRKRANFFAIRNRAGLGPAPHLPSQPRRILQNARALSGCPQAEDSAIAIRHREPGLVQRIERIQADAHADVLGDRNRLVEAGVHAADPGAWNYLVPPRIQTVVEADQLRGPIFQ